MLKQIGLAAALTASLAAAGAASAQMPKPPPPNHDPALVQSGTYTVEPYHTIVTFSLDHMGFSTYSGRFSDVSGTLTLDAKHPALSSVEIHVPVASASTTSPKLDTELKSVMFLDGAHFPEMIFKSTKVTVTGPGEAKVVGQLTLHGVTKKLALRVKFHGSGTNMMFKNYDAGFDATGTLKRSDFGVTTYLPLIGDEVKLDIAATFQNGTPVPPKP